jgi:hypothetical protein
MGCASLRIITNRRILKALTWHGKDDIRCRDANGLRHLWLRPSDSAESPPVIPEKAVKAATAAILKIIHFFLLNALEANQSRSGPHLKVDKFVDDVR